MRISYSWLKEFVPDLPSADELAEQLPMHGLEVEEVIDQSKGLEAIVVGEVLTVEKHPQADKLQLTTVQVGGEQILHIVCGAPNVRVGMKVPVALVGTTLPGGMTIERRAIRGQQSEGMLCAEDELGIGTSHEGLLEVPADARPGQSFVEVLGLDDVILDISLPSNRADLLSVRGLAREIAAVLGFTVRWPAETSSKEKLGKTSWKAAIDAGSGVQQLSLQSVREVTHPSTPEYIVRRLRSAGIRSVNVIVDITNYVMLEHGQPLHAYDADTLHGKELHGRRLKTEIPLVTLDGEERILPAECLVITDEDRALGAGGIMGGKETEVTTETKNIILEAAIFDGPSIRRSARALGLTTEAAKRFERGIWMSSPQNALRAARTLLHTICGGVVDGDIVSAGASETKAVALTVDLGVYEQRIGRSEKTSELLEALRRFGYTVKGKSSVTLTVPDWRMDVRAVEDILDDLGRVFGYEDLPALFPPSTVIPERFSESVQLKDDLRTALVQLGATEIILHATYGQQALDQVGGEHILVANPLDQTQHALRASLLPGVERVILAEVDAGRDAFVFEIGRVFLGQGGVDEQPWRVGIGFALKVPTGSAIDWELNGKIRALERLLRRAVPVSSPSVRMVKGRTIACIEFDLQSFGPAQAVVLAPQGLAPAVERDVTIEVPTNMGFEQIRQLIMALRLPLLHSVTPTNLFEADDARKLTLRCKFQDAERTLTSEEVDTMVEKITSLFRK